jgi:mono/diheme cytochrome c family protein
MDTSDSTTHKSVTAVPEGCDDYNVEALHEGLTDAGKGAPLSFPAPMVVVFAIAAFLAGAYLISLGSGGAGAVADAAGPKKPDGPYDIGKKLYKNCVACHGAGGAGTPGAYPPLAGSEYVIHGDKRPILILLYGLIGPVTVKGAPYNGTMAAWHGSFDDDQIAGLVTYIRGSWGNTAPPVGPEQVAAMRAEFDGHAQFTADQILAIPQDENVPGAPAAAAAPAAPAPAAATP